MFGVILILTTVGCDRVTKQLALTHLAGEPGQTYLAGAVRLEFAENSGAFLSLGTNLPAPLRTGLFVGGVGLLLLAVAVVAIRQRWQGMLFAGAALLWAGGASNLIDRVMRGSVVDFINFGVGPFRTGIFNVADVAIMVGAALIILGSWKQEEGV